MPLAHTYQKSAPKNSTTNRHENRALYYHYQKNSMPNCMSSVPGTGAGFLLLVFGANFW